MRNAVFQDRCSQVTIGEGDVFILSGLLSAFGTQASCDHGGGPARTAGQASINTQWGLEIGAFRLYLYSKFHCECSPEAANSKPH